MKIKQLTEREKITKSLSPKQTCKTTIKANRIPFVHQLREREVILFLHNIFAILHLKYCVRFYSLALRKYIALKCVIPHTETISQEQRLKKTLSSFL